MSGRDSKPSLLLIAVYLGRLPVWYPAFLASCRTNETTSWLIVTDAVPPASSPPNVRHRRIGGNQLESLVAERLGRRLPLIDNPRKLCDLKPTYAILFDQDVRPFDYWGYCDLDVVWGNLHSAFAGPLSEEADVFALRRHRLAGHLSLFRNRADINQLFERSPAFIPALETSNVTMFDEVAMTELVADLALEGYLRVSWPSFVLGEEFRRVLKRQVSGWVWRAGRLIDPRFGREIAYLHFTDWKSTMTRCDVRLPETAEAFEITPHGIISASNPAEDYS
jgi:hypothetical protein